jgi:hypothetical protein
MQFHDIFRKAKEFIAQEGGDIAPLRISEEELNPSEQEDLSLSAYPLESMDTCYRVPYNFPDDSICSEFSYFEDGRQRTVQIGSIQATYGDHHVMIPVHFFVVAAVILERHQRELRLWGKPEIQQGILVEKSLVPDQDLLRTFGDMIVDVPGNGGDYYQLRKYALQAVKKFRLEAENRLIAQWRQSERAPDHFLVVDGTLMNLRNEDNVERCIGVSKSFGSRYFDVSDHNRILQMKEFERSWTFRFHSPDDATDDFRLGSRERISWYLRLRSRPNVDPEFGLIRVEISQRHAGLASEYAERFSRSLLSERLPTAYPAPRWDKHLYPIQACENYLTSIMPSVSTIAASMKG